MLLVRISWFFRSPVWDQMLMIVQIIIQIVLSNYIEYITWCMAFLDNLNALCFV